MSMVNINISLKEEAYNFLSSLKTKNKSFSDVILEFKEKNNNRNIMRFFGALKDLDWGKKEKSIREFRDSFNKRLK